MTTAINFNCYNPRKAAQVIARFVYLSDAPLLPVIKAVKLVYLADRESIARYGFPILEEPRYSLPHGPVNSTTYSFISGAYDTKLYGWSEFLDDKQNHNISLAESAPKELDELSDAEIECIDAVWKKFGHMSRWDIRDWTHDPKNLPEWQDPNGGSIEIPLVRIMEAVNLENAQEQAAFVESFIAVNKVFEELRH